MVSVEDQRHWPRIDPALADAEVLLDSVPAEHSVRLFAMRDTEGEIGADCRVNGDDFQPGVAALKTYAATWPDRGFELRKQYVIYWIPSIDGDGADTA